MKESATAKMIREVCKSVFGQATDDIIKRLGPSLGGLDKDIQIKNLTAELAGTTLWAQQTEKYAERLKIEREELQYALDCQRLVSGEQSEHIKKDNRVRPTGKEVDEQNGARP